MMKKSLSYSAITLAVTLVIGQILLILFSEGNSIGSSVLFILMNLTPMFVAIAFAKSDGQKAVLKDMFLQRESIYSYILAIGSVCVYYGVSFIMGNIVDGRNNYFSIGIYAMDNPARWIRRMWLEMVFATKV
jgi:hypothetical protein